MFFTGSSFMEEITKNQNGVGAGEFWSVLELNIVL